MGHARKREEDLAFKGDVNTAKTSACPVSEADDSAKPVPSPAQGLQSMLEYEITASDDKYPARYVTALVMVTCLALWLAIFQLGAAIL